MDISKLDDLIKLLPPFVSNIGILVPFLIQSQPFILSPRIKTFVLIISCVIVWLGFFFTLWLGDLMFYAIYFTIIMLLLGLLCLWFVLTKLLKDINSNTPTTILFYILSILFLSMGFTNYFATKDKVILLINNRKHIQDISYKLNSDQTVFRMNFYNSPVYPIDGIILDKSNFDKITNITITYNNDLPLVALSKKELEILTQQYGMGVYIKLPSE